MATQAVKFYSMTEQAFESKTKDGSALYFLTNGELYKGAQRFGANKVHTANANAATLSEATAGLTNVIGGDILLGFQGAKVWDGSAWQDLSADTSSIIESVASTFTTGDNDGQLKLGSINASVSGWQDVKDDISFLKTVVSSSTENEQTTTYVTADVGTFDNLTVEGLATFNATTISASALTINGSTVEELADKQIAAIAESYAAGSANGISVSVTTSGGSVTGVTVDASAFANAVHFTGVVTSLPASPAAGDIVIIGEPEQGQSLPEGLAAGQEYICTAPANPDAQPEPTPATWELIGDQSTYATIADLENLDADLNDGSDGVNVAITQVDGLLSTITTTVSKADLNTTLGTTNVADKGVATSIGPAETIPAQGTEGQEGYVPAVPAASDSNLATEKAVRDAVASAISAAELLWLDENNDPIDDTPAQQEEP